MLIQPMVVIISLDMSDYAVMYFNYLPIKLEKNKKE